MSHKKNHETEVTPVTDPAPAPVESAEATPPIPESPILDPRDQEIAILKDRLLRLQADFDNFRKRVLRDRDDMTRRAAEKLMKELLPIADHFQLGLQAAQKHHVKHAVIEGFEGVLKQLLSILEKSGVTPIETKNKPFDPHYHECVAQIPSEEHPENMVIEETRKGYKLGTYVLRAPQVIVSSGPAAAKETDAGDGVPPAIQG